MPAVTGSQERVLSSLRAAPLRANDIAQRLSIDPSAVRRHLDTLIALKLVAYHDVIEGPGRPKRFFRLTLAGRETGPRNYAFLLAALMQKVANSQGRRALFRYLEEVAADLAASPAKAENAKRRLDLLLAKYNELGFEAELVRGKESFTLVQRNCPFLAAAGNDPEAVCRHFDEGIIRKYLPNAKVELQTALAKGDAVCRHIITLRSATEAKDKHDG